MCAFAVSTNPKLKPLKESPALLLMVTTSLKHGLNEGEKVESEKIKNALNNCIGSHPCKNCPYENGYLNFPSCAVLLMKDALDLIKQYEELE